MIKRKKTVKEYAKRLKKLASKHLHCNLDDNESGYIPPDLKEGTYRWTLYIFSNLYKKGEDKFDPKDRQMFISIFDTFLESHSISWTRDTFIELDKAKYEQIFEYLKNRIDNTISFFELKACLYASRNLLYRWFVVDPFILEMSPGLKEFVKK